jgi:hypothetical protein
MSHCLRDRPVSIGAQDNKEPINKSGISQVQIRAITNSFFHPIGEIPESIPGALRGNSDTRSDPRFAYDDIHLLRFQTPKDYLFAGSPSAWFEMQNKPGR